MSLSTTPPLDTSNPQAVQGIFSTTDATPRKKRTLNDKTLTTRRKGCWMRMQLTTIQVLSEK